jgi:prepilin-type N-terminal cleavage/methylation domain-containing protein
MANNSVVKARETIMMQSMNHPMPMGGGTNAGQPMGGPTMPPRAGRRIRPVLGREGFTLIELLVVIGIIMILMGMLFVGMKYVGNSAKTKSTHATLGNLQSMLTTYDAQGRGMINQINVAYTAYNGGYNPLPLPTPTANVTIPINPSGPPPTGQYRYDPFVQITSTIAMQKIMSVPSNKAAMDKLATRMLPSWLPAPAAPTYILLDAWDNPIIFVPAGGLDGVFYQGTTGAQKVTSKGVVATGATVDANARPFFASAGPDGDFAKGDDNVYSFEQ